MGELLGVQKSGMAEDLPLWGLGPFGYRASRPVE
jgi:hypothetical protein